MSYQTNGHTFSFSSCTFSCGSHKVSVGGLKSVSYSDSLEGGKVPGPVQCLGGTKGTYSAELSFEFTKRSDYQAFLESLGDYPYEKYWTFVNTMAEAGVSPTITDRVTRVRIKKAAQDASQGSDAIGVKVDLDVYGCVVWNGKKIAKDLVE